MSAVKALWLACQTHAHAHQHAYHRLHDWSHWAYLGLVAFHGPYHIAALVSVVIICIGVVLKLEAA